MLILIKKTLKVFAISVTLIPLSIQADDTEIYLGSADDRSKSLPNIIFIMDTSGSMDENVDGKTRLKTVQEVATEVIEESAADPNKDFNIALMSFNGSSGANVDMPMTSLSDATVKFKDTMKNYVANGGTPITESMVEALRYLKGDSPLYGTGSINSSKKNGRYKSPITNECQTNHIVLFSDGEPTVDIGSNGSILDLFTKLEHSRKASLASNSQQCSDTTGEFKDYYTYTNNQRSLYNEDGIEYIYRDRTDDGTTYWDRGRSRTLYYARFQYRYTSGYCAEELALLGQVTDLAPSTSIPGIQSATFHTVGGFVGGDALDKLKNIALYGTPFEKDKVTGLLTEPYKTVNGQNVPKNYYAANNASELKTQLSTLFGGIIKNDSTFTAPAISVNSYNRLQHNDELYYSVFSPEKNANWKGNLKRYRLIGDVIYDTKSVNAVSPTTGFFSDTSHSYWTIGDADGKAVNKGGMASRLRLPAKISEKNGRVVTTFLGNSDLTVEGNRIHPDNTNLDNYINNEMLKLGINTTPQERDKMILWASGVDVNNEDKGTDTSTSTAEFEDPRPFMEDPLHSQPVIINYTLDDSVVFLSTNSGYLHAFSPDLDSSTTEPKELFSFIPKELLKNIKPYYNGDTGKKYGLDGPMSFYHNDLNGNGILLDKTNNIETKEYIHLYASMRRGGRNYYALDVSDLSAPQYLWQIDGGEGKFKKLGQTWSKMIPAKVKWKGSEQNVLFFGGGYDRNVEDCVGNSASLNCGVGPATRKETTMGNAIFMVNAATGEYLWSASNKDAELNLTEMTNSIVSDLVVLDTNRDGLADLIYSSDTGGRIWRIDLDNEPASGTSMIAYGGLIADMNEGKTNNIRFYNTVDVAYIDDKKSLAKPHFQLSIGSGYRAHPLDTRVQNRFYLINDFNITSKPTKATELTFYTTVTESELLNSAIVDPVLDLSADNTKPKGFYYVLTASGEKVLARSITADNKVFLTTYRPNGGLTTISCEPNVGFARTYTIMPKYGDRTAAIPTADTITVIGDDLNQTGIPPQPILIFPDPGKPGTNPKKSCAGKPIIIIGAEIIDSGIECASQIKKTYWKMN
ncbi:MAG: VWA domain-containing protein [Oleispira antarctica]|nr:VWA domain-containing protein [Oleispira antarctica]MBQ0791189.1 VWA domain-containing protein [Oleispira antarctica]